MASVAESRAKQAGAAKTTPITPAHQKLAESLATWDVVRDTQFQEQLPEGTVISDYIEPIPGTVSGTIAEYRLRPFGDSRVKTPMDPTIYKLIQSRIEAAKQQRLGLTRQGQQQIKLFEDVEEPEDEVP
jgi:hypothetical protein